MIKSSDIQSYKQGCQLTSRASSICYKNKGRKVTLKSHAIFIINKHKIAEKVKTKEAMRK
jgi:hypothetical protein